MQSRTLKNLMMLLFVTYILSSCTSDYIVPEPPVIPVPDSLQSIISYSGEIQPIFDAHCIICHKVGGDDPVLVNGKSRDALFAMSGMVDTIVPTNSKLYKSMASGGNMAGYCSQADADSTLKWIRQGARNN